MEVILYSFRIAIVALVAISIHHVASFKFHCDNPDVQPGNFIPNETWPNGQVIYQLHFSLGPTGVIEVKKAFDDIESKTCIRFIPKQIVDDSYVSIERDNTVCGLASTCRQGGPQFARFGEDCTTSNVMVHELGHTLCLSHEHTRFDRDDFVNYSNCSASEIQPKEDFETRGHFYDYTSQMHYQCGFCELGGFPVMDGVTRCGMDVQTGLSVADADKINDLYDCRECFSHRWRRIETLTNDQESQLVSFGDNASLHLCRGYVGDGEISPGQYSNDQRTCTVNLNGVVSRRTDKFQVFTIPNGDAMQRYRTLDERNNFVPVGRTKDAVTIYAAVSTVTDEEEEQFIGKVYANDLSQAHFSEGESVVTRSSYLGITCT